MTRLVPAATAALLIAAASPALAEASYTSTVPGLAIAPLTDLPPAPMNQGDREFCLHKLVPQFTTPGGEVAHFQGWGVTGEEPFGPLTAVSFVGGFTGGTSGGCELNDGNIGLFQGGDLKAVIYATDPQSTLIGFVAPLWPDGLRIWSGGYLAEPLADIRPDGAGGAAIVPLAASETVCGGAAEVPLIYGLPILEARQRLIAAGWQPVPRAADQGVDSLTTGLIAEGIPEVDECSGTGYGFCAFRYTRPTADLSVTTAGEGGSMSPVVGYGEACR